MLEEKIERLEIFLIGAQKTYFTTSEELCLGLRKNILK